MLQKQSQGRTCLWLQRKCPHFPHNGASHILFLSNLPLPTELFSLQIICPNGCDFLGCYHDLHTLLKTFNRKHPNQDIKELIAKQLTKHVVNYVVIQYPEAYIVSALEAFTWFLSCSPRRHLLL